MEFLFLVGHGLLSPISTIRWGMSRLQRTAAGLTPEQKRLIDHVHAHAKRLALAVTSMLLVARNEDQTYTITPRMTRVRDLLALHTCGTGHPPAVHLRIACPADAAVMGDRALLDAAFRNLFAVFEEAHADPCEVAVQVQPEEGSVTVHFACSLHLSTLSVRSATDGNVHPAIGGTPGLLLSLTSSLLQCTHGSLTMRESDPGRYRITVHLVRAE